MKHNFKSLILCFTAIALISIAYSFWENNHVSAKKIALKLKTDRKASARKNHNLIELTASESDTLLRDTIFNKIVITGYDKPATSSKESFFLTNNSGRKIASIEIEIIYQTMDGRRLDRVVREIKKTIPQGETTKIDLQAWDTQRSFHYHKSAASRQRATMPYDVIITPTKITLYALPSL
ncbi:MAG: hypothetical protein NC097_07000 [Clostridium sp.]|nr:hypothetical protein [Prevotella sp.]MCM1429528.1 hypothetical protein [Clostridium sp.]MCM1476144.1 hypothetical protein [Muribaculaceae bacterium]